MELSLLAIMAFFGDVMKLLLMDGFEIKGVLTNWGCKGDSIWLIKSECGIWFLVITVSLSLLEVELL